MGYNWDATDDTYREAIQIAAKGAAKKIIPYEQTEYTGYKFWIVLKPDQTMANLHITNDKPDPDESIN